jgi:hypothetical protein
MCVLGIVVLEHERVGVVAALVNDHHVGLEVTVAEHVTGQELRGSCVTQARIDHFEAASRVELVELRFDE